MASIKKRGNSYLITVSNGRDVNGKKRIETKTYKPTATTPKKIEKELREIAQTFEKQVLNGEYYEGAKIRLDEFIEKWKVSRLADKLTTAAYESYVDILEKILIPSIGHLRLEEIKIYHIQPLVDKWTNEGKAPKTVRRRITPLRSVLKYAYTMSLISENPCDRIIYPSLKQDNELHYFSIEQAETFLRIIQEPFTIYYKEQTRTLKKTGKKYTVPAFTEEYSISPQFTPYFYLAIYGGFRRGEIIALNWNDIDFESRTVRINKAVSKTKTGQIIKGTKTIAGNREIILPSIVFTKLKEWQTLYKEMLMMNSKTWESKKGKQFDENPVFIQIENGKRMDVDTPSHKFDSIIKHYNLTCKNEEDKLPEIRLHDLRHTSATLLLANNVDIETVSHRLGHSKASITLDVYGHAMKDKDITAADTLEKILHA